MPNGFGRSGGMREDNITSLKSRIEKEGLNMNSYSCALDLRKYGSTSYGGFGIGIERLVRWITNLEDIKECTLFQEQWPGLIHDILIFDSYVTILVKKLQVLELVSLYI